MQTEFRGMYDNSIVRKSKLDIEQMERKLFKVFETLNSKQDSK